MAKERVLVDTCIIIEAFRINCWKALCAKFDVETVEECVEEACRGDRLNPKYVPVDRKALTSGLTAIHPVTDEQLAALTLGSVDLPALDAGELNLMAWLNANQPGALKVLISTTDKAALRATFVLNWIDQVRSLEMLGRAAGVDKRQLEKLEHHFSEGWMSAVRTHLAQGVL
jgi:hypothetical protein